MQYTHNRMEERKLLSSAFLDWAGKDREEKGSFFLKFHTQSKYWKNGTKKVEIIPSFRWNCRRGNLFLLGAEYSYKNFFVARLGQVRLMF